MLKDDLKKVRQLLTMAVNEGASVHEKLSFTKKALKIVERIEDAPEVFSEPDDRPWNVDEAFAQAIRTATHSTTRTRAARPVPSGKSDTRIKTNAAGFCSICDDGYPKGAFVIFLRESRRFCHTDCYNGEAAETP